MIKLVQIGAIGHYEYALPTAQKYKMDFSAACFPHRDDDRERAMRDFAKFGFAPQIYDDWREMLEVERPQMAVINTVMAWNGEMAAYAMERGISVFCEKPVATTFEMLDNLEKIYYAAKKKHPKLVFAGMFGIDYLPHFETAYRYIKSGALGDIRLASAQKSYRLGNRESFYSNREEYGGTIPWVGVHAIEWIIRLGGLKPISVSAVGSTECNGGNGTMEVSTACLFQSEDGKMATVTADVLRPRSAPTHDDDRLRFVGSLGIVEVRDKKCIVIDKNCEREVPIEKTEWELFEEMYMEMVGKGKCRVTAEDTFFSTRVALSAREAQDRGTIVFIKPQK